MKMIHLHTSTLRVSPLGCLKQKLPCYACEVSWPKQNKHKDHSPSMTLFKVALQNGLGPSKMLRYLANIANHGYTMTHARPVYIQR